MVSLISQSTVACWEWQWLPFSLLVWTGHGGPDMQSRFLLSCWPWLSLLSLYRWLDRTNCRKMFGVERSSDRGFGDERMRFHTRQHSISTLAFPQSMPTWTGKVLFVELWRLLKHRVLETTGQTRSNTDCPNWLDKTVLMEQREVQDVAPSKFALRELNCLQNGRWVSSVLEEMQGLKYEEEWGYRKQLHYV